jgi:hypothetical protein
MSESVALTKNRQLQIDFEQAYGVSKFLLFLADRLTPAEYKRMLKYQLEFFEQLADESRESH